MKHATVKVEAVSELLTSRDSSRYTPGRRYEMGMSLLES
jgi:hypothetical protein